MDVKHYVMKSKTLPCSFTRQNPTPAESAEVPPQLNARLQGNKHSSVPRASWSAECYLKQWFEWRRHVNKSLELIFMVRYIKTVNANLTYDNGWIH